MTQPAPESDETTEPVAVDLDHMICPICFDNGHRIMMCGSPLDAIPVFDHGAPMLDTPCAVCFAEPTLICNNCGSVVHTH